MEEEYWGEGRGRGGGKDGLKKKKDGMKAAGWSSWGFCSEKCSAVRLGALSERELKGIRRVYAGYEGCGDLGFGGVGGLRKRWGGEKGGLGRVGSNVQRQL